MSDHFLDEPKPPNPIIAATSGSISGSSSSAFSFWSTKQMNEWQRKPKQSLWEQRHKQLEVSSRMLLLELWPAPKIQ